jgi:hypothetical protein
MDFIEPLSQHNAVKHMCATQASAHSSNKHRQTTSKVVVGTTTAGLTTQALAGQMIMHYCGNLLMGLTV